MKTKHCILTLLATIVSMSSFSQSVEMNSLSTKKTMSGDKLDTGYVGTIEIGGSLTANLLDSGDIDDVVEISTVHGYAISPIFTIGAGAAFHYNFELHHFAGNNFSLPVFLDLRTYFIRYGKVRPYLDLRAGYEFSLSKATWEDNQFNCFQDSNYYYDDEVQVKHYRNSKGLYLSASLGIRIIKRIDFSVGVGLRGTECKEIGIATPAETSFIKCNDIPIDFRLGYRF